MTSKLDRETISAFARGDERLRHAAIAIHRRNISLIGVRGDVFQRFMAEVDHPCPDLALRAYYRIAVIEFKDEDVSPIPPPPPSKVGFLGKIMARIGFSRAA